MRIGVSGTHGTGKTTLVGELCARLPGHVAADEPYVLLEDDGYEFGFPPSAEDYQAQLARSVQLLRSSGPDVVFDRTPVDFLAYLAAQGADADVDPAVLRPAMAGLNLLIILPVTVETEQLLPAAELPQLRHAVNNALLDLVYADPLQAWADVLVAELDGPLDRRCATALAALPAPLRRQVRPSAGG
ncbi:MAG TPA: AAA family ATPase [Streptosporangiaceae bacterium]